MRYHDLEFCFKLCCSETHSSFSHPVDDISQVSKERYIEIPAEVQQVYKTWRPSPLFRARNLEKVPTRPSQPALPNTQTFNAMVSTWSLFRASLGPVLEIPCSSRGTPSPPLRSCSEHRRGSTTSTRVFPPPAPTSPTRPFRRPASRHTYPTPSENHTAVCCAQPSVLVSVRHNPRDAAAHKLVCCELGHPR